MDDTRLNCDDHFVIYTNMESYCATETNLMSYANYISIKDN